MGQITPEMSPLSGRRPQEPLGHSGESLETPGVGARPAPRVSSGPAKHLGTGAVGAGSRRTPSDQEPCPPPGQAWSHTPQSREGSGHTSLRATRPRAAEPEASGSGLPLIGTRGAEGPLEVSSRVRFLLCPLRSSVRALLGCGGGPG